MCLRVRYIGGAGAVCSGVVWSCIMHVLLMFRVLLMGIYSFLEGDIPMVMLPSTLTKLILFFLFKFLLLGLSDTLFSLFS